jgi:transketolase
MTPSITCRKMFVDTLFELAKKDRNIIAIATDSRGSVGLEKIVEGLPDQFVDVGIAEQNAIGIGAGLAKCGKKVFVCGPSCFQTARACEQIKVDIAYCQSNVKVVGVSGGISYGALGSSHHSVHDIALIRTMPGMTVILPSDIHQTRKMTEALVDYVGPVYVRFGRDPVPDVYEEGSAPFEIGKANVVMQGSDITIIGTGETVRIGLDAAILLGEKGIRARVIDLHTIKPLDVETIIQAARETRGIITAEDHSIYGGLGGTVSEVVVQHCAVPMKIIGVPDEPAITGTQAQIFKHYGVTAENIAQVAAKMVKDRS